MNEDLVGYLLGALDRDAEEQVENELAENPAARRDLDRIGWFVRPLGDAGDVDPPVGLAQRTVRKVMRHRQSETSVAGLPGTWRLADLAVAASILFAISLVVLPALSESRQKRALVDCSNNLRNLGVAMVSYSEKFGGYLPFVSASGPFGVAGIYAPILLETGMVSDASMFVCPESADDARRVYTFDRVRAAESDLRMLQSMLSSVGGSYGYSLGFRENGAYRAPRRDRVSGKIMLVDRPARPSEGDVGHSNSPNHGGRGQNVLCPDGSVRFLAHPYECPGCDNLFLNQLNRVEPGCNHDDSVLGPSDARMGGECEEY